jgi:UPF0042 nucleotide-binding protein
MTKDNPRALVVTGLSGAGKSVVTRCFEDLGYRCVDNLPLELIEPLFAHVFGTAGPPWVVVSDVRTEGFAKVFPEMLVRLKSRHSGLRVLFVEAATSTVVRRFSETRRPHPYRHLSLSEAVRRERDEMQAVRDLADDVLDTTELTPHDLRAAVASRFGSTEHALPMVIRCLSFGFRYGLPSDANLVFDVRFLPNPHFIPHLRPLPGDHPTVKEWLDSHAEVNDTFELFKNLCDVLLPAYRREQKSSVVIAFGCTGGRHRSVYLADRLGNYLQTGAWVSSVEHRDRDREQ